MFASGPSWFSAVSRLARKLTQRRSSTGLSDCQHRSPRICAPGAWPLAVHVWIRGASASGYGGTAAAALLLAIIIWVLQGVAQLRALPDAAQQEDL